MWGGLKGSAMRSIDLRIPLLAGAAIILLAVSPARAHSAANDIVFAPGTGEPVAVAQPVDAPAPMPFADAHSEADDSQAEMMDMAEKLGDPRMQDGVAAMVSSMTEQMMDFPIGKFAVTLEQAIPGSLRDKRGKRIRASDTVADLAGGDAEHLSNDLANGSRQMMGMMSGLAAAFATMIPEFEKLSRDMEQSLEDVKRARRPHD
jgi:hypothetical protein